MTAANTATQASADAAHKGFSTSILISGIRCLLTYIVLPFVTPWLGLASGVGPVLGLIVGLVAIAANGFSIRRFWRADHRWKKHMTAIHVVVIAMMMVLMVFDVRELLS